MTHSTQAEIAFPDPETALDDPNGLLATGGDLSIDRLKFAYQHGIFPWFNSDEEAILWWCPDPRAILYPTELKIHRSMRKFIRATTLRITFDTAFEAVVQACQQPRKKQMGTWITSSMKAAYTELHAAGFAHSVEVWDGETLVGGLYGTSFGKMFFGESMFSTSSNASKYALISLVTHLTRWSFNLIDCQIMNNHLASLGAREIPRKEFLDLLTLNRQLTTHSGKWQFTSC